MIQDNDKLRVTIATQTYLFVLCYGHLNRSMTFDEQVNAMNDWLTRLAIVTCLRMIDFTKDVSKMSVNVPKLLSAFLKSFVFGFSKGFFILSDIPFQIEDIATTLEA
ncbi:hypothetical protein [Mycoplasmopsis pullorum]|nr:hypothetical protein [Mycoplasmopsis pullorum]